MKHSYSLRWAAFCCLLLFTILPQSAQAQIVFGCDVAGGRLATPDGLVRVPICLDDGDEQPLDLVLSDNVGTANRYFLTNLSGFIRQELTGGPPFDLSGLAAGNFAIYSVSFNGALIDAEVGENICNVTATECLSLSNSVVILRQTGDDCEDADCMVDAGSLELTDEGGTVTTRCLTTGATDAVAVTLSGTPEGDLMTFVITDDAGLILGVPAGNGPFNLTGAGPGTCNIYYVSYREDLVGLAEGNTLNDLDGCFALSNPVTVNRVTGGDCPGDNDFVATLSGLNELPCPVTTTGFGEVTATLEGNTLTVTGSFANLTSDFDADVMGGAHIHTGMAGMGGPITYLLDTDVDADLRGGSFSAANNTFELSDDEVETLRARGFYVNIHTEDFGGGEIRGQIVPSGADGYRAAYLLGVNEVPAVISPAIGAVIIERTGNEITLSGAFSGLEGTIATQIAGGAHIHVGIAGRNGPVIIPLNMEISDDMTAATFEADSNTYTLTEEQVAAMGNDMLYVNIHSSEVISGEIRGQVAPLGVSQFYSNPSGHQARPMAINTEGNGRLLLSLDEENNLRVSGSVQDLSSNVDESIAGGAHLHLNVAGSNGPVVFALDFTADDVGTGGMWLPEDNTFALNDEQVMAFMQREYYANIHTLEFGAGEVRGQVMNLAKGYFGSNLAGINANPEAKKTDGGGFIMYEMCDGSLTATGSFADLDSDFDASIAGGSHIHFGDAAGTGPIVFGLEVDIADDLRSGVYTASANEFELSEEQREALIAGDYYFNLHTVDNPSGEIRGQILRDDNAFPTQVEVITPEDGVSITVFEDGSDLEEGAFTNASDPNDDLLVYTIEVTLPGDTDFEEVQLCRKVGTDTFSRVTIDQLYDTLIANGAVNGVSINLLYRVVSSDGSVATPGDTRTISVTTGVRPDSCNVLGGDLRLTTGGTTSTICAGDGQPDPFNVILTDTMGTAFTYLVVDDAGMILGAPANQPFDFDGAGGGACTLYAVSHDGSLTGAVMGGQFEDLGGCFALSNPIVVTRLTGDECDDICDVDGGTLTLEDGSDAFTICAGDGEADPFNVILTDTSGAEFTYIVVDDMGMILGTPANQPFDFDGAGGGACTLYAVSHDGSLTGAAMGEPLSGLEGCFDLSNPIVVTRLTGDECNQENNFTANLSGLNELPNPVTTTGRGTLTGTLEGNTLTVTGSFTGLTSQVDQSIAGGAHLHAGMAGMGGPIIFELVADYDDDLLGGSFSADDNTFELSDEQMMALRARGVYVNIHTFDHQGGEIRGQMLPAGADDYMVAYLLGVNEVPAVITTAIGAVTVERTGSSIVVSGGVNGLSSAVATEIAGGAHIHTGMAGENGPVIIPLNIELNEDSTEVIFMADSNTYELTAEQVTNLAQEGLYVNVHTQNFRGGEVRGQIADMAVTQLYSNPSGHQARPMAINTPGNGRLLINITSTNEFTVSGSVDDLMGPIAVDIAGGAHLHLNVAGSNGPVVFPLNFTLDDDSQGGNWLPSENTFSLNEEQLMAMLDRGYYANIHTTAHPSGEVRGQVLNLAKGYLGSNLAGYNALPEAKKTTGTGFVVYELYSGSLVATGSFDMLVSDFDASIAGGSHIHVGSVTETGPIAFGLEVNVADDLRSGVYEADSNRFELTEEQFDLFVDGGYYFNLHTVDNPSGEIRGQIRRDDNAFPGSPEIVEPEDGATVTVFPGGSDLEDGFFSGVEDTDGDTVTYLLEIATTDDTDFEEVLFCLNLGVDTFTTATIDQLYDSIIAFGGVAGISIPLAYRIVATDGSVASAGASRMVTIRVQDSPGVVINELMDDGTVELYNTSDDLVDISDYYLISGAESDVLTNLKNECGSLLLGPGEFVTVDASSLLNKTGDELALATRDRYIGPGVIMSYVAYGNGGDRDGEQLAITAGVWNESLAVGAPSSSLSIQRTERNAAVAYILGDPTLCGANLSVSTSNPAAERLSVYPNPFAGTLTIEATGVTNSRTDATILDINGRVVLQRQVELAAGRITLPVAELAAGSYVLRLANDSGVSTVRLVRE